MVLKQILQEIVTKYNENMTFKQPMRRIYRIETVFRVNVPLT